MSLDNVTSISKKQRQAVNVNKSNPTSKALFKYSELRFQSILDNLLEGFQIIDFNQRYLYVNLAAERHSHKSKEELIGKRFADVWSKDQNTKLFDAIQHGLEWRVQEKFDTEFTYPDQTKSWFKIRIEPVPEGIFILSIDVSELKALAPRCSEFFFRQVYENSYDAILLTDAEGTIFSANPAARRMFGMTEKQIQKAGLTGLLVMDTRAKLAIEQRIRRGRSRAELTFKRKDGSTFEGEATSALFTDGDGEIEASIIIRDIAKPKQSEEASGQIE